MTIPEISLDHPKRRVFLQRGAALSAAWALQGVLPAFWSTAALAASSASGYGRLLILVELKGGNDGLNTLVPYADPAYYALRPRIGIKRDNVLQLSESEGLHASLAPLMPLWTAGELAVIRGVGYPRPNLSHFRSIEIWDTASSAEDYLQQGWLARAFAANPAPPEFAADGVIIGNGDLGPLAGGSRVVTLANTEQFLRQARLANAGATQTKSRDARALGHILRVESDITHAADGLGGGATLSTDFPNGAFGNAVRTASQVISGRGQIAALRLSLNGFDTHQNQPAVQANLLRQLGEGLAALKAALVEMGRWDSTLILTYAEFGRRAQENASNGTDHGTANVHFALGGRVKGGLLGESPRLDRLGNGNLAHAVDFRSVYATALSRWWGLDAARVLGARYSTLELVKT